MIPFFTFYLFAHVKMDIVDKNHEFYNFNEKINAVFSKFNLF